MKILKKNPENSGKERDYSSRLLSSSRLRAFAPSREKEETRDGQTALEFLGRLISLYQNPLIKSLYNLIFLRWAASLAWPVFNEYRRCTRLLAQHKNLGVLNALSFGVLVLGAEGAKLWSNFRAQLSNLAFWSSHEGANARRREEEKPEELEGLFCLPLLRSFAPFCGKPFFAAGF